MDESRRNTDVPATNASGVVIDAKQPTAALEDKAAAPVAASEPDKKKHRTVGNIIYDFGIFGSIAWAGVAALSAVSAHEAMHGNNKYFGWLRAINNGVSSGLSKALSKTIMKNSSPELIEGYAKGTTMFVTLGMGGNALMAPIKWMEDNRQKNAAKIDNLLGTTPPDPETIKKEPHQTWHSVFSGRMMSWGLSYVAFLAMGPKLTGKLSNYFGEHAAEAYMKWKPHADPVKVRRWADIAAFDALFTVITAAATYGFSRAVAKKDDKKHDLEEEMYRSNPVLPTAMEEKQAVHHKAFTDKVKKEPRKAEAPQELYAQKLDSEALTDRVR